MQPNQVEGGAAVIAALVSGPYVLCIIQPDRHDPQYKFAGGTVEQGEDIMQALIREVAEETGYVISPADSPPEKVLERDLSRPIPHTQHFFLVPVEERDLFNLDDKILKEDHVETIQTKVFHTDVLRALPNFLRPQRPLLQALEERLRQSAPAPATA
jgi:8-oxo-dGTP pyrophosphatase MutT (NUDIX family)